MRFYENRLLRPLPVLTFAVGLILLNPLDFPPTPRAQAEPVVEAVVAEAQPEKELVARTPDAAKAYAKTRIDHFGWTSEQSWQCLLSLWTKESNWRPNAYNDTPVYQNGVGLHAGGIPQILGLNPNTPVEHQIERGFTYIEHRYGSPCSAWRFWQSNNWY